jgi:phytoene dehydrogenase-like protein
VRTEAYDAVVVGAGPNGLTAAVELARAGVSVAVLEAQPEIGGGTRSAELTLPGFVHDVCSAIHPVGALSPAFRALDLEARGVAWVEPEIALAHPFDDGSAACVARSLEETAEGLGADGRAYEALLRPFVESAEPLFDEILRPIRFPRRPLLMARFGLAGLRSSDALVRARFEGARTRALFAGCAAHSLVPLSFPGSASFGVVLLACAHVASWPCVRGGSSRIAQALAAVLEQHGGEVHTGRPVRSLDDLPDARAVLFDLTPRQVLEICGEALPPRYRRRLSRYRYGPGVFKVDWALGGPIPWRAEGCRRAGTVHVGGSCESIAAGEAAAWRGAHSERPLVLVGQQSLFDPSRAPAGRHTGWAYCHVPHGSTVDMTDAIERQVERFAPGFRDLILARHTLAPAQLEAHNQNMIGGDIAGGANTLGQLLGRPLPKLDPYATPNERLFLCSSSTPPGAGVHGMCGLHAARSALKRRFGIRSVAEAASEPAARRKSSTVPLREHER